MTLVNSLVGTVSNSINIIFLQHVANSAISENGPVVNGLSRLNPTSLMSDTSLRTGTDGESLCSPIFGSKECWVIPGTGPPNWAPPKGPEKMLYQLTGFECTMFTVYICLYCLYFVNLCMLN